MKKYSKFVFAMVMMAPLALAQQGNVTREAGGWTQEINGTLAAVKILRVRIQAGAVKVQGGPINAITYTYHSRVNGSSEDKARREFESYKINAYVRGDTAWINGEWPNGGSHRFFGEFLLNVPKEIELVKIETGGGPVNVNGVDGRVEAETGGGKIRLENIGGSVNAETGGDTIEAMTIGGDLNASTGGGKLYFGNVKGLITASTGGGGMVLQSCDRDVELESGAGDILVKQSGGKLKISTGGGNLDVGDIGGPVQMETGGGSIRLSSAKGLVKAYTGSGRIELNGVPAVHAETGNGPIVVRMIPGGSDRADSILETGTGDIVVYIPANLNISVRAAIDMANGHKIHSDFSEIPVQMENVDWPQTLTTEGNLNGGGPLLKVKTASGDIWFRRAQ